VKRTHWAVPVALMLLAVTACTSGDEEGVATVDGGGAPTTAPPTDDILALELEFIACMRDQGVEMVDPIPGDTSGRSALIYEIDVNGKGSDPAFQAALDVCAEFLPEPPPAEPPTDDELSALRAYAQCMRDNGLPDYPDPGPDGQLDYWLLRDDPVAQAAVEACGHLVPSNE
jgi:hypothetical protein